MTIDLGPGILALLWTWTVIAAFVAMIFIFYGDRR